MNFRMVMLLPVGALLIVAGMLGTVLLLGESHSSAPRASALTTVTPAPTHDASVCQSLLYRPDPSTGRSYPAIYTKITEAKGITIVADAAVSDDAIVEAKRTIERVFRNNNLAESLHEEGAYVIIADSRQGILDLPEFGCLARESAADVVSHACGIADHADYPVATVNELDLTSVPTGPCSGLNILYHELGHLVQGWALAPVDYIDIKLDYQAAIDAGKYRRLYAATNFNEYFAEATQAYFLHANTDGSHDRQWLQRYDPAIYELVARVYGD